MTSDKKYIILAGSHIDDYAWLRQQIQAKDKLICADSGARHAHAINIIPDIIIGDFDSIAPEILEFYQGQCDIIHDNDENTTDLMKAIACAPTNATIEIYGAMGQRADHDFSNYLILKSMNNPERITLRSQYEDRRVVKQSVTIHGQVGDYVGMFPLDPINDFKTAGLKYAPDVLGGSYEFGWNGACNELSDETAHIEFSSGTLLITKSSRSSC